MNARDECYINMRGYKFIEVIGAGGNGVVYHIYDPKYKRDFALKSIFETKFRQNEVDSMKMLDDPYIVNLYHYEFYDGSVYLLMEYCPISLEAYIRKNHQIPREKLVRYSLGILKSIRACHFHNIAHHDIKPGNFLIDQYDRIRICDFGLSVVQSEIGLEQNYAGSVPFMAPEILTKKPHDSIKADIWAIGVTFFTMATGMLPWPGKDRVTLCRNLLNMPPCLDFIKDQSFATVVSECLSPDPKLRPTIDDLLDRPIFREYSSTMIDKKRNNRYLAIAKSCINAQSSLIIKPRVQCKRNTKSTNEAISN